MNKSAAPKTYVLDTSAFIMGYDPSAIKERQVTVPSIQTELKSNRVIWLRFTLARQMGKIELLDPSSRSKAIVHNMAAKTGDLDRLSPVDMDLLAIAIDLQRAGVSPTLISDDYSIQNVADQFHLKYQSLSTLGIRSQFQWIHYCPACYRKYPSTIRQCSFCGTPLKRRVRKRQLTKKKP